MSSGGRKLEVSKVLVVVRRLREIAGWESDGIEGCDECFLIDRNYLGPIVVTLSEILMNCQLFTHLVVPKPSNFQPTPSNNSQKHSKPQKSIT